MGIDSECQLFRAISGIYLDPLIERSVYNRRKRKLFHFIEVIRVKMSDTFNEFEQYFIVDSMPLEVCKNSRTNRSKVRKKEYATSPERGYCASQNQWFYGYKIHAICSIQGVFKTLDITKANIHDLFHYDSKKKRHAFLEIGIIVPNIDLYSLLVVLSGIPNCNILVVIIFPTCFQKFYCIIFYFFLSEM